MFNVPCGCVKPCLEQEKIKTWCVFMFSCTEILSFLTDKTLHSWVCVSHDRGLPRNVLTSIYLFNNLLRFSRNHSDDLLKSSEV